MQQAGIKSLRVLCTGGSGFIGVHLCHSLIEQGFSLINFDKNQPKNDEHLCFWHNGDILDAGSTTRIFSEFQPTHVIHLAARTVLEGKSLDDFRDNTDGTANVLAAIKSCNSVSKVIITSTQHVFKPGPNLPKSDDDFDPYGLYGESKVITEKLTRAAALNACWTIIRPTNIWGPWHPQYPRGLWNLMRKGFYFHPKHDPVVRSYGYVKNVVWQIERIFQAPADSVNQRMYYVGEKPINQSDWVRAFSIAISGKPAYLLPKNIIYVLALIGDVAAMFGIKFPMYSDRYRNLTTTNPVPMEPIFDQFGSPPYSMEEGIRETVEWYRSQI